MIPNSLQPIVARRSEQLERIKALISLKTYDALRLKLSLEAQTASETHAVAAKVIEHHDREQALPKTLFTQRNLPRKAIRID